ncbi:MAG: ABC transporter ATP-binding protein [Acidobacteriota bacterium]
MSASTDLVQLAGVGKSYRRSERPVLDGVDLRVARGEIVGIVGPNGAGKTTLLGIIAGLVRQDAGTVEVLGGLMPRDEVSVKGSLGIVTDRMALHRGETLAWHLELAASLSPSWDGALADALLARFELWPGMRGGAMSRGQTMKALLTMTLARRPRLLLLDEATAGLCPFSRRDLLGLLAETVASTGTGILMATHVLEDIAAIAHRVVMLSGGCIVRDGPPETLTAAWRAA